MHNTFITTTSYGTWLPGDARGYTENGELLPPTPPLAEAARRLMNDPPVFFSEREQDELFSAACDAAGEFDYHLSDITIESWHVHLIMAHPDDAEVMIGRVKNRLRQKLDRGRVWTKGYAARKLYTQADVEGARSYIAQHRGCRMLRGEVLPRR